MGYLNRVLLMGNLTRAPEQRILPNGRSVVSCGIAVNHRYKTASGEQKDEAMFIDFNLFGPRAEAFMKYFGKGDPVLLEGRLELNRWTDSTGQAQRRHRVIVEDWQFVPRRGGGAQGSEAKPAIPAAASPAENVPWEAEADPFTPSDESADPVGAGYSGEDPF